MRNGKVENNTNKKEIQRNRREKIDKTKRRKK